MDGWGLTFRAMLDQLSKAKAKEYNVLLLLRESGVFIVKVSTAIF